MGWFTVDKAIFDTLAELWFRPWVPQAAWLVLVAEALVYFSSLGRVTRAQVGM